MQLSSLFYSPPPFPQAAGAVDPGEVAAPACGEGPEETTPATNHIWEQREKLEQALQV